MKVVVHLVAGLLLASTAQAQWVRQPFTFALPTDLALNINAVDANTAWAASSGQLSPGNNPTNQVARTFDGGQNWTVLTIADIKLASEKVTNIASISATTAWVTTVKTDGGSRILKTVNAGATWVAQGSADIFGRPDSYANDIYFFNANDGVALGDPDGENGGGMEIYHTSNGGTTWTRSLNVPIGSADEYGTEYPSAIVGNSIWFPSNRGDIFRSTDKGVTWTVSKQVGTTEDPITGVAFRDAQNGLAFIRSASDTQHKLYRSSDAGSTWVPVVYTGPLHGWGITRIPGTNNYLSVGRNAGNKDQGSSYSQDNGKTWINLESTINHLFVDAASPTAVWSGNVSSPGSGANKLTSTVLGSRGATLVLGASLSPNPSADGQFRMQWPTAAHTGAVTLTVFDALGRQVQHSTFDASRGAETTLGLSNEKAGIYQVKLESRNGVSQLRAQVQ